MQTKQTNSMLWFGAGCGLVTSSFVFGKEHAKEFRRQSDWINNFWGASLTGFVFLPLSKNILK